MLGLTDSAEDKLIEMMEAEKKTIIRIKHGNGCYDLHEIILDEKSEDDKVISFKCMNRKDKNLPLFVRIGDSLSDLIIDYIPAYQKVQGYFNFYYPLLEDGMLTEGTIDFAIDFYKSYKDDFKNMLSKLKPRYKTSDIIGLVGNGIKELRKESEALSVKANILSNNMGGLYKKIALLADNESECYTQGIYTRKALKNLSEETSIDYKNLLKEWENIDVINKDLSKVCFAINTLTKRIGKTEKEIPYR